MAIASPSRPERAGPLDVFARYFKGQHKKEKGSDDDDLSRILRQTHIKSNTPTRPLPDLPFPQALVQYQQLHHQRILHSVSLQHYPSSHDHIKRPLSPAGKTSHHAGYQPDYLPHMPTPSLYIQRDRPSSVDHLSAKQMPDPWELKAEVPASSVKPAVLTPTHVNRPVSAPILPTLEKRAKRSKKIVVDRLQRPGLHQCWGIKQDNTRCTRRVGGSTSSPSKGRSPSKSPSPSKGRAKKDSEVIIVTDSDEESGDDYSGDEEEEEYCYQHSKKINKSNGFDLPGPRGNSSKGRVGGDRTQIDYSTYLRDIISRGNQEEENTMAKLRRAMSKPPSEVDWSERGYIYIYELRDRSTPTHIALKVGRAVNVYKRFEQWRSQCQSKSPTLRAFFPRPDGLAQDVLPGAASVLEEGALLSHRWETLIHIELSYLGMRLNDKCIDCGTRHREIFLIPRSEGIGYDSVQRAVERWLSFVRLVARDGLGGR